MSNIIERLRILASERPHELAFVTTEVLTNSDRLITYKQLIDEVDRVSSLLTRNDVRCVAIEIENGYEWLIADLSALAANVACVPVPVFFSESQKQHLYRSAGIDCLVTTNRSSSELCLGQLSPNVDIQTLTGFSPDNVLEGTAKITFTSGSTGTPKGVCLSAEQLGRVSQSLYDQLPQLSQNHDRHLVMLPLSTLLENITGIYVPILAGIPSVILSGDKVGLIGSSQFNPQQFYAALEQYRPATLVLTPALLEALLWVTHEAPELKRGLKFIAVGGAKVPLSLLEKAQLAELPVYEGYGLSECASVVSVNSPQHAKVGTVGKPLDHHTVTIESGEICVSPPGFLGYLGEKYTATTYPTGDMGEWTESGFLRVIGRKKNIIISSFGRNISPEWIETQAYSWTSLRKITVVGEGEDSLSAMVIGNEVPEIVEALYELNKTLPDYARIHSVTVVSDPSQITPLFTQNCRPKRQDIQQQLQHWKQSVQRPAYLSMCEIKAN
ncbi:AMP-binding protein [Vibrio viridaestus]|uniref:Long-chain fatty acid--CoA ligase n=1 Tax=Vibrio viridaestus TaxID=2487322 RepID=A0A3N9TKL0_9VIBR|nr:AMP-binding protein [Vibrio viridaestus]RQW64879.1 long-chain fatty acid--CoA ligase [Vibrio viridaestus]